jgi:hypothetical protein
MSDECGKCWKCKEGTGCIRSITFAPSAMPTRHPEVKPILDKDKQWERDMPAYKRLRQNGLQPKRIDDSAILETRANDQFEVEMGKIVPDRVKPQVKEGLALVQAMEESAKPQVTRTQVAPDE